MLLHIPPPHAPRYARAKQLVHAVLCERRDGSTVKQIARATQLDKSSIWRALSEMADEGMIVREVSDQCRKPFVYRLREVTQ